MIYKMNTDVVMEIAVRVILWVLFLYYDYADPFIRHINPNEAWLYSYPVTQSFIPSRTLWVIIIVYPVTVGLVEYFLKNDDAGPRTVFKSLTFAYALNGLLTSIIKNAVGRPRPDFVSRCFPNGMGTDYTKCTGLRKAYLDGRKSFPSGHSSFAFTCMVFMCLYQARKLNFTTAKAGKTCICIFPLLIASLIAISRTCDYHHHYQDVIAGSMLGSLIAYLTYYLYIPNDSNKPQVETS